MKIYFLHILLLLSILLTAQENNCHESPAQFSGNLMRYTAKIGVTNSIFDGSFDSPLWEQLPTYNFLHNVTDARHINLIPSEKACVRYLCDPENLFVRVDAQDHDIMTCASDNNQFHYRMGDVVEVFIKPKDHPYYWEFYGTPNEFFSCFYYKSPGTLQLPSSFAPGKVKIGVINKITGSLNQHSDRDKSWQVIIVIPRRELEKNNCRFAFPQRWTILTARYNYGRYLPCNERSAYPQVANGYHATRHYANIEFIDLDRKEK